MEKYENLKGSGYVLLKIKYRELKIIRKYSQLLIF